MDVQFTLEQQSRLSLIATRDGMETSQLVQAKALHVLKDDDDFRQGVRRGIALADRCELIPHDEVKARIGRLLANR